MRTTLVSPRSFFALLLASLGVMMGPASSRAAQVISKDGTFRVLCPPHWHAEARPTGIMLYTGKLREEGRVPLHGALITVSGFPPYSTPHFEPGRSDEANLAELARGNKITSQTPADGGQRAQLTSLNPDLNFRETLTVRHVNDRTFLTTVRAAADDPKGPSYDAIGDKVVSSITLVS